MIYIVSSVTLSSRTITNDTVLVLVAVRNVGRRQAKGISRRTFYFYAKTR